MNKPSPADSVLALLAQALDRIAGTLERMAPQGSLTADFDAADAFIWQAATKRLHHKAGF